MKNTNTIFTGIKHLLLLLLIFCLTQYSAAQNNIRLSPVVQPAMGHKAQVGSNLNISGTLGQPAFSTLQNGNVAITQGFQQPEMPLPPVAPASQTVCSDTAVTFSYTHLTGAAADKLEWSYDSAFSYSTILSADSLLRITVNIGSADTIWLRSRVSGSKLVSSAVYTILKVNLKPEAPTPPAPVTVNSDTAHTFTFVNLRPGYGGNQLEWTLDSSFATSWLMTCYDTTIGGKDTSDCTISFAVDTQTATLFWLRCMDTLTGCISDARSGIAIVTHVYQRRPISADSIINICEGNVAYIKVPGSTHTHRYDLLADTGSVFTAYGNDTTLYLNTGSVFTTTFFSILSIDTATGDTASIGGNILVDVLGVVDTNIYIEGDTLVYDGDTAFYHASAINGIKAIYSLVTGTAIIDSLKGKVYAISSDFTLRATIEGPVGCGSINKDINVEITSIAAPIAPTPVTVLIDSVTQIATIVFDTVISGVGGNQIEWATNDKFTKSIILSSPAIITIDLKGISDSIIWLRSRNSSNGHHSLPVQTSAKTDWPLLSASLLDKRNWQIDQYLSDEFNYNGGYLSYPYSIPGFLQKWALNYPWAPPSYGDEMSPASCNNHEIWHQETVQLYNSGNYDGTHIDGSGNEVSVENGIAHLKATRFYSGGVPTTITYTCDEAATYPITKTFSYKSGMLLSKDVYDLTKPGLFEIRAKLPAGNGAWPAFWLTGSAEWNIYPHESNLELDVLETSITTSDRTSGSATIHDYSHDSQSAYPRFDTDGNPTGQVVCGRTYHKQTPCDYTEDWHTYSCIVTGDEVMFFVDGKETWSELRNQTFPYPKYTTRARMIINLAINGEEVNPGPSVIHYEPYNDAPDEYDFQIDYVRYYTPANTSGIPFLQNFNNGDPKTLEGVNANGQSDNNTPLTIANNNYNHGKTHDMKVCKIAYSNEPGLQKIYYAGTDGKCYNAYLENGQWLEYPLVDWIADVKGEITVDGDRVYYVSPLNELKFFQWISGANYWLNCGTGVFCNVNSVFYTVQGILHLDDLGRIFYIGPDNNIYAWCPNGPFTGTNVAVTASGDATGTLDVHPCGCLIFYENNSGNLLQKSWWNSWLDKGIIANVSAAPSMVIDPDNSNIYFSANVGDKGVYCYNWDFNSLNPTGLKRLEGQSFCDLNVLSSADGLPAPLSFLQLNTTNQILYYVGCDEHLWYCFNDHDIDRPKNWYRSPINYSDIDYAEKTLGPTAIEPWLGGKLFYRGLDAKLHVVDWLNADNPLDCITAEWGNYNVYKTDERNENIDSNIVSELQDVIINSLTKHINVSVFPNPSTNKFTILMKGLEDNTIIDFKVISTEGETIYATFTTGCSKKEIVWNADNAKGGIYYYVIKLSTGELLTGKMVKL